MADYGFIRMIDHTYSLPFFLGDSSLRNTLQTLFIWAVIVSHCALISIRRINLPDSYRSFYLSRTDYAYVFIIVVSISFSIWRFLGIKSSLRCQDMKTNVAGTKQQTPSFKRALTISVLSALIIASTCCRPLSLEHLLIISLSIVLSNWRFMPTLFKVCLAVAAVDYTRFTREHYVRTHTLEAYNFLYTIRMFMVDHYFKFFALTVVSQFSGIYISSLCDGLAVHLVVLLFSKFSLLPVLIRLYSGANSYLSTEFTLPRLVARLRGPFCRTRTRTCSVSNSVSTRVSDMRMPVFPSSDSEVPRYYVQLVTAALFSILNASLSLKNCFSTEDDIWAVLARGLLKPTTLWVIFGTLVVQRSLVGLVIHIFSKACACEKCLLTRSKDVRKRTNSESDSPICLNHPESYEITEKCSSNSTLSTKQINSMGHNFGIPQKSVEGTRSAESKFSAVTTPATSSSKRVADLNDAEVLELISTGKLKTRELESALENLARAVCIRRQDLALRLANPHALERIPHCNFDYRPVIGQCCEEVIGFVPIPLGKVGPLLLDGREHYVPLATTEGCLVASTNRGCRALYLAGGVTTAVFRDQMTRAPVVAFPSVCEVVECMAWLESKKGFTMLRDAFNETSSHADLLSIFPNPCGRYLHLRFAARTGEAMGMNMVSKGTDRALRVLCTQFPRMQVVSLSGNMCTDKKPAAINYILGRGKSVLAEAYLPDSVIASILHTSASTLAHLARVKNWTGSAMAGSPGMAGCNAHAANIVAALFASTGQDLAQVVDSSACITQMELEPSGGLYVSVTMPCLEVGTVGGGTRLPAQRACIEMLDLSLERPTEHLARLLAGVVVAGELSLLAALATNDLVEAHMRLNRASAASQRAGAEICSVEKEAAEGEDRTADDLTAPDVQHTFM